MAQHPQVFRRLGYEEMGETGIHVYDRAGSRIGHVRAFQKIPGGLRVWILASSPDGRQRVGLSGEDIAEFVADLEGAYVSSADAR